MSFRILVSDVDGVLILTDQPFSWTYADERGLDRSLFKDFFRGEFQKTLVGQADLKELLELNRDLWQWKGPVDDLMQLWFQSETNLNKPVIEKVLWLKSRGIPRYFATNQEKYHGEYIRHEIFADMFDGDFVSGDMGVKKPDHKYFEMILEHFATKHPDITPAEVLFIDDTVEHVESARGLGIQAIHYNGENLEEVLKILSNPKA